MVVTNPFLPQTSGCMRQIRDHTGLLECVSPPPTCSRLRAQIDTHRLCLKGCRLGKYHNNLELVNLSVDAPRQHAPLDYGVKIMPVGSYPTLLKTVLIRLGSLVQIQSRPRISTATKEHLCPSLGVTLTCLGYPCYCLNRLAYQHSLQVSIRAQRSGALSQKRG